LRATLITLCFVLGEYLHVNILKFVAGDGTVVQPASINIEFGANKHSNTVEHINWVFITTVRWSAQNAESHCSHVHVTLIVEHFSCFNAF